MKKILLPLLVLCLSIGIICVSNIQAEAATYNIASGQAGNIEWCIDDEGTLIFSGSGEIPDYARGSSTPWYNYSYYINSIIIGDGITRIGDFAFEGLTNAKSIDLGNSVQSIGIFCFLQAGITTIEFPNSLTTIEQSAFCMCENLQYVEIPNTVTSLDNGAFESCTSLSWAIVNSQEFFLSAFMECSNLKNVYISKDVGVIAYAFTECISLENIFYEGTKAEWDAINKSSAEYGTSYFANANVYYNVDYDNYESLTRNHVGPGYTINLPTTNTNLEFYSFTPEITDFYTYKKEQYGGVYYMYGVITRTYSPGTTYVMCIDKTNNTCYGVYRVQVNCSSYELSGCGDRNNLFSLYQNPTNISFEVNGQNSNVLSFVSSERYQQYSWGTYGLYTDYYDSYYLTGLTKLPIGTHKITVKVDGKVFESITYTREEHNYEIVDQKSNSCTSDGYIEYECSKCWNNYQDNLPAYGHSYDNNCDTICNSCDEIRNISHIYSHSCDKFCNICNYERNIYHSYDNACDSQCNICYASRPVSPHQYDNTCDTACNICNAVRTVEPHEYDNACDSTCNICNVVRTVEPHKYDNTCDTTCNVCSAKRTIEHTYDDKYDKLCNICQESRKVPLKPGAIVLVSLGGTTITAGTVFSVFWFAVKKKNWSDLLAVLKSTKANVEKLIKQILK